MVLRSLGCRSPPIVTFRANFLNSSEGKNFHKISPLISSPLFKKSITLELACKISKLSLVRIRVKFGLLSKVSNKVLELTLSFKSFSMSHLNRMCPATAAIIIIRRTAKVTRSIMAFKSSLSLDTTLFCCITWIAYMGALVIGVTINT